MGDFILTAEHPSCPGAYVTLAIEAPSLGDAQDLAFCLISTYMLLGTVIRYPGDPGGGDYLFTYNHGQGLCLAAIEASSLAEASAILDAFAQDGVVVEAQHGR